MNLNDRFCWLYLLSSMLLAWCCVGMRGIRHFGHDRSVRHAWLIDGLMAIAQKSLLWAFMSPVFLLWPTMVTHQLVGPVTPVTWPLWANVLYSLGSLLVMDLAFFTTHVLQHRIAPLWVFHSVHHSAERLTPFTAFRVHPVDDLLTLMVSASAFGGLNAGLAYVVGSLPTPLSIAGLEPGLLVFYLAGFLLRHSEVPLSFGHFLSAHLVSPVQHQWHHLKSDATPVVNYGFIFTWWDRCLGTYQAPKNHSPSLVGVDGVQHRTLLSMFLAPWSALLALERGALWFVTLLALSVTISVQSWTLLQESLRQKTVLMEKLTRPDIEARIQNGVSTLIVPTGGVEQNGAHLMVGKHNAVIEAAARSLADALGDALVAPVVAYVPNGQLDPPTGHMQFVGGFSISDVHYADYLADIIESARIQGFKRVILLHAHGDSVAPENALARRINQSIHSKSFEVKVANTYYDDAPLRTELAKQGWDVQSFGHHAGSLDSSELLAVAPEGVWLSRLTVPDPGRDGDALVANLWLGEALKALRLEATVKALKNP